LTQSLTGVQRFAIELTRQLSEQRQVTILTPPGAEQEAIGDAKVQVIGRRTGQLWEQLDLPTHLNRIGRPLLLNLTSTGPVLYANQVVTHHDITYVRHPDSFSRRFRLAYRFMMPLLLRRSREILTVSAFSKAEIAAHYRIDARKINVVPNAASPLFAPDGVAEKPSDYLLAVSSPNRHKNFHTLIRAFCSAETTTINRLLIVGDQTGVFRATDLRPSDSRVEFFGRVTDERLAELYRGAIAFAFPSLYEGFGIPPLEAQQSGLPVIAAHTASMPEVLGASALYFDPQDVGSVTAAIEEIDRNASLRETLRVTGLRNANRFSWRTSAAELIRVIDRINTREN
jgi:glycosyltransferase involved in cell wall biosynthesis